MRGRRADAAFLVACAAAASACAGLLLPYLHDRLMHRDEALALMVGRRPLGQLLETVQLVRGGAPLHFLLASAVAHLGGGLAATRLVSAVFAVVAVVGVGLVGRALFGPLEGVVGAVGVALCPVALFYGDFARMYSLFLALSTLALWCLVRALDTGRPRFWAGTAVLLALDVYAHPYGVVVGVVAGLTALAALLRRGERAAFRPALLAAAGVLACTLPLLVGYLVLASRLGEVRTPPGAPLPEPPVGDVLYQAFANFLGVPRPAGAGSWIAAYLIAAGALALLGLLAAAREDLTRGVLLALWLALPAATIAIVRTPGTDNHVRYLIEALPAVILLVAHGAVLLGRALGPAGALAAAVVVAAGLGGVELGRGRDLSAYRYRDPLPLAAKLAIERDAAYLRARFAAHDLFLGYDPAFAYGVIDAGGNRALAAARGVARSEAPLVVRSLDRLHGPIDHGWYVAVRGRGGRAQAFRAALGDGYEVLVLDGLPWVVVHTRRGHLTPRAFALAGLRVFRAARHDLRDPNAATTVAALSAAVSALGNRRPA